MRCPRAKPHGRRFLARLSLMLPPAPMTAPRPRRAPSHAMLPGAARSSVGGTPGSSLADPGVGLGTESLRAGLRRRSSCSSSSSASEASGPRPRLSRSEDEDEDEGRISGLQSRPPLSSPPIVARKTPAGTGHDMERSASPTRSGDERGRPAYALRATARQARAGDEYGLRITTASGLPLSAFQHFSVSAFSSCVLPRPAAAPACTREMTLNEVRKAIAVNGPNTERGMRNGEGGIRGLAGMDIARKGDRS